MSKKDISEWYMPASFDKAKQVEILSKYVKDLGIKAKVISALRTVYYEDKLNSYRIQRLIIVFKSEDDMNFYKLSTHFKACGIFQIECEVRT